VVRNSKSRRQYKLFKSIAGVSLVMLLSCTQEVNVRFIDTHNLPLMSGKDVDMHYTDSSILKIRVKAPEILDFSNQEEKRVEFPKGITVIQYNKDGHETSRIRSDYAIHWPDKEKWEAKKNVVVTNEDGRVLKTEFLVWDMKSHKFYTDQNVRIQDGENITYGKGFEADEKMKNWKVISPSGEKILDDEK